VNATYKDHFDPVYISKKEVGFLEGCFFQPVIRPYESFLIGWKKPAFRKSHFFLAM